MGNRYLYLAGALAVSMLVLCSGGLGQEKERPKLKDFGSSLKRAKPDEKKKPANDPNQNLPPTPQPKISMW